LTLFVEYGACCAQHIYWRTMFVVKEVVWYITS